MNYSNSQRAGLILYPTALIFGTYYKPFQIYKEQVLKRLEHTELTLEKKQDCVISLFAYVHGLAALVTMPNAKYDLGWENKLEDLIATLCVNG